MATTAWFGLELTGRVERVQDLSESPPQISLSQGAEPSTAANPGDSALGGFLRLDFFLLTYTHMHRCIAVYQV